jgi:DNA polymerase-3 subunit delta
MLIFVYGDDTFRVREKVRELEGAFRKKFDPTGMNSQSFPSEGKAIEMGDVLQAACSMPFMAAKRLVVVRDLIAGIKKDSEDAWTAGLARVPESTVCILWETLEPSALEKKAAFKTLAKGADVHKYPFPLLEGAALEKWTAQRIVSRGGTADASTVRELVSRVGADLWRLDAEIAKLVAYASGRTIDAKDVEAMVRPSFEGEIFALMDAMSRREGKSALQKLREERWAGAEDFQLFAMLARQVRLLLAARAFLDEGKSDKGGFADEMGVHPFVAQKTLQQARAFTYEEMLALHDQLFRLDQEMKTGGCDAELAVDLIATGFVK